MISDFCIFTVCEKERRGAYYIASLNLHQMK